jgi:hypothetical protein
VNEFSCFVSLLVRQAARNLYQLEFISRIRGWINWWYHRDLWCARRLMAMTPDEAAAWLPALAFAVSCERNANVLPEFARWSFPEPLPPEAMPWRDRLIQVWEQYPADTEWEKSIRLAGLVRLDRRVERLPEWLQEARQAMDMKPENRHLRLTALAGWRPRPGDLPAHGDSREAVLQWGQFWKKSLRNYRLKPDALIAAVALLHLTEAGWLPAGLSPERLRAEFRQRVRLWSTNTCHKSEILRILVSSVPADASSPERQDITDWLELTRKDVDWEKRAAVWGMLVSWQREGILERCGISLVPDLARTLEWERDRCVLLAMAGYVPKAAEVRAHPKELRAVVACWEALSRSTNSWELYYRQAAWVARWNLLRGGAITAKKQARFAADYVDAIRSEKAPDVLLVLAQIRPPGPFPLTAWVRRLSDGDDACRLAAGLAIHRWLGEVMEGANGEWRVGRQYGQFPELPLRLAITRRQVRQALRRAGQEGAAGTVAPFANLPREVRSDFRRLHEIETALAAGQMPPPPPDAGMEPQSASRAVPSRLPEALLRSTQVGGTGQKGRGGTHSPSPLFWDCPS